MVDALASDRSDQPFGEAVLPRRAWGDGLVADAHGAQAVRDGGAIDAIPIADHVAPRLSPRECFGDLLLIVAGLRSLLGRFRLALLAQPKTLQQCGHGVAEAAILQLGIGQHRGARPALTAHLDSFALGALADLVPRRVVEEIGTGLRKSAFIVARKAVARNDRHAVHASHGW